MAPGVRRVHLAVEGGAELGHHAGQFDLCVRQKFRAVRVLDLGREGFEEVCRAYLAFRPIA